MDGKRNHFKDIVLTNKLMYVISVFVAMLGVACEIIPYFILSNVIVELLNKTAGIQVYIRQVWLIVLCMVIRAIMHNISTMLSHRATFNVITKIRLAIAHKLSRVPLGYVLETPSGKLKNMMVERIDSIEPSLAHLLPEMTANLLVPISIIAYLFTVDIRMALASLITLVIGFMCTMGMMQNYNKNYMRTVNAEKNANAVSVEYVNGIEVIKTFNQSGASYKKYTKAVKDYAESMSAWMKSVQIFVSLGKGIWPAVLVGVLPIGCILYFNGSLAAGDFILIIILSLGIITPLVKAISYTDHLAKIKYTIGEINEILNIEELPMADKDCVPNDNSIVLKNVSFGYTGEAVIKNANLTINKNALTSFVGPSGSGKSTIAKLITRLWDVDDGEILIGGKNIKDIPYDKLMDTVAYVSQDNYLFDDTIYNNIRVGKKDATDKEIEEAAKKSGCHDFIMDLDDGYNTVAGSAGGHLSGGERQRITIARAMLKDSPIIILDEATAYTDPENEALIQKSVAKLVVGKTLIVIAHRLSTIVESDKIVLVNKGKIEETGTHNELLRKSKLYKNMWLSHIAYKDTKTLGEEAVG